MNNKLINELKELVKEEKELLTKHKDKHFKDVKEGEQYIQENRGELKRLNEIQSRIRDIEWNLMTAKEQQDLLDFYEKVKEKHSDE